MLKAVEACLRVLRDDDTGRLLFRRSDIDRMTDEQLARAQATITMLNKRVGELQRLMG